MLIKFDSEVGSFSMDREIAVQLLRSMGHSGTVPGAMLASDIPGALSRLKSMVDKAPANSGSPPPKGEDEGAEAPVSLRQRAYPLIDLLSRASAQGKEVLWK
jgi:hypothetical protein